jgi:hypothetical protein
MMPERSVPEPSDYVIWGASSLLALVLGLGSAFFLWVVLHRSEHPELARGAVASLGLGLVLIGVAVDRPMTRAFFILLAVVLAAAFAFGGPEFARLAP